MKEKQIPTHVCPYPSCRHVFPVDEPGERIAECPACGRRSAARSPNTWRRALTQAVVRNKTAENKEEENGNKAVCAIVEDVRSLFNVGSMFRTADAAGIGPLYLCGITGCPPRPQIAKVSLGAEDHVAWQYLPHPLDIVGDLKSKGVTVIALERNKSSQCLIEVLKDKRVHKPVCFIVGNEVTGISPEVLDNSDYVCHLPMKGIKESLNVSVAFGIAAYFLETLL